LQIGAKILKIASCGSTVRNEPGCASNQPSTVNLAPGRLPSNFTRPNEERRSQPRPRNPHFECCRRVPADNDSRGPFPPNAPQQTGIRKQVVLMRTEAKRVTAKIRV